MKQNNIYTLGIVLLIAAISISCMVFQADRSAPSVVDSPPETGKEESEPSAAEVDAPEEEKGELLRQWAVSATASSEYGNQDFSASQATGQPDTTEECGDFPITWASAERTGVDWLELMYECPSTLSRSISIKTIYSTRWWRLKCWIAREPTTRSIPTYQS